MSTAAAHGQRTAHVATASFACPATAKPSGLGTIRQGTAHYFTPSQEGPKHMS
jgi:hypothetical protein